MRKILLFNLIVGLMAAANGFCGVVPNGSFEEGEKWPTGWSVKDGIGTWENDAHSGKKCISLTGDGMTDPKWISDRFQLDTNKMYRMSVWLKAPRSAWSFMVFSGGIFGASQPIIWEPVVHHPEWKKYDFVFQSPDTPRPFFVQFWTFYHRGKLFVDDINIAEVKPVYLENDGMELGDGEKIKDNAYVAETAFHSPNIRFLYKHEGGGFLGSRWYVFSEGIVFRHKAGEIMQTEASFKFFVNWNPRGKVTALVSKDGKNFKQVYEGRKLYWTDIIAIPAEFFPAKEIYIWFRCMPTPEERTPKDEKNAMLTFELSKYEYKAKLAEKVPDIEGKTEFIETPK